MDSDKTNIEKLIEDSTFRNWVLRSNQQDFERWEMLLNRDAELKRTAEEAKSIVLLTELAEDGISEKENRRALAELTRKIEVKEASLLREDPGHPAISMKRPSWIRYAAAVALLAVGGSGYYLVSNFTNNARSAKLNVEQSTQSGQLLTLQLADGSKMRLNANSTVNMPEDFASERTVRLTGEAFFEVAKNPKLPFTVITENFTVEVVGTSFNINSYRNQQNKILVESGIVKVKANTNEKNLLTLSKNQAALFDKEKNQLVYTDFNANEFLWRDGILMFSDDNITSVAGKLEHWYGVTIEISNPEKIKEEFTGTYEKETLENILHGMSYVLDFSYTIDKARKRVIINPN